MDNEELKEELGQLARRLDNVEGYFDNFATTLNNHMSDYGDKVTALAEKLAEMKGRDDLAGTLIRWVVFPLIMVLAGLIGIRLMWPGG